MAKFIPQSDPAQYSLNKLPCPSLPHADQSNLSSLISRIEEQLQALSQGLASADSSLPPIISEIGNVKVYASAGTTNSSNVIISSVNYKSATFATFATQSGSPIGATTIVTPGTYLMFVTGYTSVASSIMVANEALINFAALQLKVNGSAAVSPSGVAALGAFNDSVSGTVQTGGGFPASASGWTLQTLSIGDVITASFAVSSPFTSVFQQNINFSMIGTF